MMMSLWNLHSVHF